MKTSMSLMMLKDRYPEAVNSSGAARLQTAISTSTWGVGGAGPGAAGTASVTQDTTGPAAGGGPAESLHPVCPLIQNALC